MIPNSQPILDYWFPACGLPPQAFTMEAGANEPVQILPDWLKLKMIRSPVDRLVDVALIDLNPDQIMLFVQNFGTPVNSMSKLLALLDRAVIEQFEAVKQVIMNKAYLAQLIEIQQTRGAKNGHIAVQALDLHGQILPDPPKRDVILDDSGQIDFGGAVEHIAPMVTSRTKEIEEIVDLVMSGKPLSRSNYVRFRKLMQQLIAKDVPGKKLSSKQSTVYGTATNMQTYASGKVLQYFHRLLKGPHGQYIFQKVGQNANVCTLLRSLLTWQPEKPDNLAFMIQVMNQCIQSINPTTNPVLFQVLVNKRKMFTKATDEKLPIVRQDLIQVLNSAGMMELEVQGKQFLNELSLQSDTGYLVDAITAALKGTGAESEKIGLLVDWLANIDSELVVSTREHQLDLLFSRSLHQFRFYLLSLLSHQASWTTLYATLKRLLAEYHGDYDAASVLHFIEALVRNPKLWQGRDKATPKHEQVEYVLNMNPTQIEVFTDYVLSESGCSTEDRLNDRVQTLLKCVSPDKLQLRRLIVYVQDHPGDAAVRLKFLQQLYLNVPPMKFAVADLPNVYNSDATQMIGCVADVIANFMLTAISSLSAAKEYQSMSADMELLVRKLAATHPALVLRQLPVIASLLQGRAHMDFHVLRQKSMPLFNQVLGILELLQPLVFEEPHKDALHQALDCYFTLLRYHGHAKDVYLLMYRFMELLQAYTNDNANRALNFIEQYAELMQYLSNGNRNIRPLQQLVQGVSMLKHRHTHDFRNINRSEDISAEDQVQQVAGSSSASVLNDAPTAPEPDSTGAASVILARYAKQNLTPPHWTTWVQMVQRNSGEEIVGALQEIEMFTTKRQGLLDPLFERFLELLTSPTAAIRDTSHTLLVRHLKYNPGDATVNAKALNAYVQCLRHPDTMVVAAALETLTEIVICLQENAADILRLVFDLGIQSKQNTFDPIRRCLLALKTQHAC